jgi:formate hydrogenlyase subunit 6
VLNIFRRSLSIGTVTTGYPSTPETAPAAYRGQVILREERCSGDGSCARVCPSQAITVEASERGWVWTLDDRRCVFCGLCADVCPALAIELTGEFELAVRDPDALMTIIRFVADPGRDATDARTGDAR